MADAVSDTTMTPKEQLPVTKNTLFFKWRTKNNPINATQELWVKNPYVEELADAIGVPGFKPN